MLKITTEPEIDGVRLKLEGDLAGTGVRVLEEFWLTAHLPFAGPAVCVDLSGVSRVDDAGRFLLALIHRTGARMVTAGVEMKELVASIGLDWPPVRLEGPGSTRMQREPLRRRKS